MAIRSETELYLPIKNYLNGLGYEIKGEVNHCDLVGLRGDEPLPIIVELKRTFNLSLVLQGIERLKVSDRVYLAVERERTGRSARGKKWRELTRLCQMLGLGLITVIFYKTKEPFVEVLCDCNLHERGAGTSPKLSLKRSTRLVHEFLERSGDYNVGGSTRRKLMTAYRQQALHIAYFLRQHEQASPRQLRALSGYGRTAHVLQTNVYGWFERVNRGVYRLTPSGEAELRANAEFLRQTLDTAGEDG